MHRSGKFDITDDSAAHVTNYRPIRKSLLYLKPDKLFRRPTKDAAITDAAQPVSRLVRRATSDGTSPTAKTENNDQSHLTVATTTSDIRMVEYQPKPAAIVSKNGGEFQPKVEYRQIQPQRSFERTGSLRDRWRQLNDEFKRLYQQHSTSPDATSSQGHATQRQGQTKVTKVNRFKDIDRRFSHLSRAVGNMSARQIHNTTSGRNGSLEVTSSKPEVNLTPTTNIGERGVGMSEAATEEGFLSKSEDPRRHLYTDNTVVESTARRKSLPENRHQLQGQYLPVISPAVAGSESIGWYPDSQSTTNRQSNDERPSSSLYSRFPGRTDHYIACEQCEPTAVLPPREYKYKIVCKHCGMTITPSTADIDDDNDDDVRSQSMKWSRDVYTEDRQPFRMVISTTLRRYLLQTILVHDTAPREENNAFKNAKFLTVLSLINKTKTNPKPRNLIAHLNLHTTPNYFYSPGSSTIKK